MKGNHHKIEAFQSKISGKKRILLDGKLLTKKTELLAMFHYSFYSIHNTYFQIKQEYKTDNFELIIDNVKFSDLLTNQSIK